MAKREEKRSLDAQIEDASAELVELRAQAEELASDRSTGTDLVPAGATAETARTRMQALRSAAEKARTEVKQKAGELDRLLDKKKAELDRIMDEAMAALDPLNEMVKTLKEGIWTVNLYLGTQEQIKVVQDGPPAPADTPITVRQMVLYMDEECAVFATDDEGLGGGETHWFDEWLAKDPAHLEQVLPEPRGIVALKPRRYTRRQNPSEDDDKTYFLVRNGGRLYRLWTDFKVDTHLVPRSNEFTRLFEEKVGYGKDARRRTMVPGTSQWERAQEEAQGLERHYMRVALILQGLVDRTTVFMPLPDHWRDGGLFLDRDHHERGHVRFLMDAEHALGTGHEPFKDWQARTNAEIRVGMRIIGAFRGNAEFGQHEYEHSGGNSRLHPATAERPQNGMIYTIEDRQGDAYIIRYVRTAKVWDPSGWRESPDRPGWGWRGEHRESKVRASCKLYPGDKFFVCFDEMTIEQAERWLRSRTDRHNYTGMFPVLHAAIEGKKYEWAAEEPLRQMVAGLLVRDNDATPEDATREAPDLIEWAKKKNRVHRTLVAGEDPMLMVDPETGNAEGAKIVQQIVREHARRVKDRRRTVKPEVMTALLASHRNPIVVARRTDGRFLVLEPQPGDRAGVFVQVHEHYARDGRLAKTDEWRLPGGRLNSMTILHSTEAWEKWDRQATLGQYLAGPEIEEQAERLLALYEARDEEEPPVASVLYSHRDRTFTVYTVHEPAKVNDVKMLTGAQQDVTMLRRAHGWRRTVGMAVELEGIARGRRGSVVTWPNDYHGDGKRPTWASETALFRDGAVLAEAEREHARYMAGQERREKLLAAADKAVASIKAQWVKAEWDKAYARFMDEYGDPALWEGHKKTLRDPSWPHGSHYSYSSGGLEKLVKRLVERGVQINGLTVTAAAELGKQHDVEYKVPTDIASFVFDYTAPTDVTVANLTIEDEDEDDDDDDIPWVSEDDDDDD